MYSRCLLLSLPAAPLTFPPHNKRAPLNALYGVVVGVLESCHFIRSENFAFPPPGPEEDTPLPPVDRMTDSVKTLPCRNFVAGGNNKLKLAFSKFYSCV